MQCGGILWPSPWPSVFDVNGDTSVNDVAREMVSNGIHRVFVREQSRIVGVVSALDILKLVTR